MVSSASIRVLVISYAYFVAVGSDNATVLAFGSSRLWGDEFFLN